VNEPGLARRLWTDEVDILGLKTPSLLEPNTPGQNALHENRWLSTVRVCVAGLPIAKHQCCVYRGSSMR
jgi:hypothetical protein